VNDDEEPCDGPVWLGPEVEADWLWVLLLECEAQQAGR
jgi:hypothetical protein